MRGSPGLGSAQGCKEVTWLSFSRASLLPEEAVNTQMVKSSNVVGHLSTEHAFTEPEVASTVPFHPEPFAFCSRTYLSKVFPHKTSLVVLAHLLKFIG